MENKSTDLIAKLLANEDITVSHANVSTAMFNIKTRMLTLPQWHNMSTDLTGMLVGHEVGHALYTGQEYLEHEYKDLPHFQGYLNVLEDVRIEKLMKRRYPGIRKTMTAGYKELNDKDFFEVKTKDLNDLLLIDRINLYFKAGFNCGVTFTKNEKNFVDRAERTETIEDVISLAYELYQATKEELEAKMEEQEAEMENEEDNDLDGEMSADPGSWMDDDEMEEYEATGGDNEVTSTKASTGSKKDALESITERALRQNMEELADTSIEYKYYKVGKFLYEPFVSHTDVRKEIKREMEKYSFHDSFKMNEEKLKKLEEFKSNSNGVVNYLVKEFEMRKAATMYKRATVAKSGQLDMRKIYSYKLQDDLFKRITSVKQGKNHGMVFLLDWSGSMSSCITQTLEQVINLAMFCRRAQIPFQVMAFSSQFPNESWIQNAATTLRYERREQAPTDELYVNNECMSLLEFFNHKMTNSEFNTMVTNLKTFREALALGSTPLNECLAYMNDYLPKFKAKYNVEKLTFITLTDGDGNFLNAGSSHIQGRRFDHTGRQLTIKNFIFDEKTKKSYEFKNNVASTQTNALLSIIKDTHDVTILGFYLTGTSYHALHNAINSHYHGVDNLSPVIDRMKKEFKANGYASLKGTGRDDLFIVPLASTRIEDRSFDDIDGDASAAAIARKFGKVLNKKKTSRILLNKFIGYVA